MPTNKRYKRDFKELEARRRRGMRMLEQGASQAAVARELGVSRQTVSAWKQALGDGGRPWQNKPLGRPAGLSAADKAKLVRLLDAGTVAHGFARANWTLSLVGRLIAREFGPAYSTVHVMRLLRGLGYPLQRANADSRAEARSAPDGRGGVPVAVGSD
jgi:transposase